ncbi:MAG: hypothetical protein HY868_16925 [Chloroflexi bacterium]|nr:hypothetical protein [Chloroflexota bacterium]
MFTRFVLLGVIALLFLGLIGCGTAPTPTPAPTQPPIIQTVIITATPAPVTATPVPPPATAVLPTAVVTPTVAVVASPTRVAVVNTPRPAATRTPTKPAVVPTATPFPLKFGAPVLNAPIWTDSQKDQVVARGGAMVLDWKSLGGLGGDECYRIDIRTEPINPGPGVVAKSDYWIVKCGDQTAVNASVKFTIESPLRGGSAPNYGSIEPEGEMWAYWTLTVVKNLGSCDANYQFHCKTAPISAPGQGYFKFVRAS